MWTMNAFVHNEKNERLNAIRRIIIKNNIIRIGADDFVFGVAITTQTARMREIPHYNILMRF